MDRRLLRDLTVSSVGLGCMGMSEFYGTGDDDESVAVIHRALDLGCTFLDTADMYGPFTNERLVGRAIAGRRDEVVLATKFGNERKEDGSWVGVNGRPGYVHRACDASLERLGVDRIDLYQVHWPNPAVPLRSTMAGMGRLQQEGVVANVGVSNFTLARWQAAERALGGPVLSNQVRYSLVARRPEREVLPWAAASDRLVMAYSPLGQGLLSGRWTPTDRPRNGVRRANPLFLAENLDRVSGLLGTLAEVGRAHDATSAQVALAWVIRRPNTVAIPGARTVAQLESNVAAADLDLTDDEDAALTAASDAFSPLRLPAAVTGGLRRRG